MHTTPQQHTADFLSASGYAPETILSYLEEAAAAGKLEADGRIRIGDAIYDWADNPGRPALYEFDRLAAMDEENRPRVKTWRMFKRSRFFKGVNTSIPSSPQESNSGGPLPPGAPEG